MASPNTESARPSDQPIARDSWRRRWSICTRRLWLMTSTSTSVGSATPFMVSLDSKGNISMLIELNVISLLVMLLVIALTFYWCPWSRLLTTTVTTGSTQALADAPVRTDVLAEDVPQAEELQAEEEPQAVQAVPAPAPAPAPPPPQPITVPPPSVLVSRAGRAYHINPHCGSLVHVPVTEFPARRRCTV